MDNKKLIKIKHGNILQQMECEKLFDRIFKKF